MLFTVVPKGESNGSEFRPYYRLLRRKGVDLGNWPRAWAPGGGRWLPVWDTEAEAAAFARELKPHTPGAEWDVVGVDQPTSRGPLGPIEVQMGRLRASWVFE